MRNIEKIKQMNIDEMANLLFDVAHDEYLCEEHRKPDYSGCNGQYCLDFIKQWLMQETK